MNAVCALTYDVSRSKEVEFKFYNMCSTSRQSHSTAKTLFESIDQHLINNRISW